MIIFYRHTATHIYESSSVHTVPVSSLRLTFVYSFALCTKMATIADVLRALMDTLPLPVEFVSPVEIAIVNKTIDIVQFFLESSNPH